jgi:5-methylcytosine-specific restriction endonuclease McrA
MDANIKHNSAYGKLVLHEDFLTICKNNPCQALLLSVLEERAKEVGLEFIPFAYSDFHEAIHGMYGRSSIINNLKDMEQKGMIQVQPYPEQDVCAYEYRLNFTQIQNMLDVLATKTAKGKYKRKLSSIPTLQAQLKILQRFNGRCAYCQINEAEVWDHIIPKFRGGESIPNNLVPACTPCNGSKSSKDVLLWLHLQGLEPSQQLQEMFQVLGITQ